MKLVADIKSRQDSNDEELACLSAILGTEIHDVKFCLQRPGTVELAIMASLTLGDIISLDTNAVPPDVLDLFKQTLDILFQALPAAEIAERQLDPSITRNPRDGNFDEFIASRLHNFLQVCISSQVPSTSSFIVRGSCLRTCLKSLWYCARAYYRPGAPVSLPSYFPHTLASPALICRIQAEKDPVARVIGRCFSALVATKLAAGVGSVNSEVWARGEKLACLSTILGIGSHSVRFCLRRPGTIELASMVSLVWGDADSIVTNALPPDVLDMVQQTLDTLSQTLPAEEIAELQPDHSIAQFISPLRKFDLIIISRLHNLLQMSLSGTSPFTSEVRRSGLQMCLKSLWNCIRAYHQLGASNPLPPYFLRIFATPEIIRHIRHGLRDDRASRVIGRCFQALVVAKLAADSSHAPFFVAAIASWWRASLLSLTLIPVW
ncbi:hypothetical protein EI94DRAFT_887468 [Lactarius quietus]|nr:hypothetical protein EI94DRAFT_887468 [Lactarius quietus]